MAALGDLVKACDRKKRWYPARIVAEDGSPRSRSITLLACMVMKQLYKGA